MQNPLFVLTNFYLVVCFSALHQWVCSIIILRMIRFGFCLASLRHEDRNKLFLFLIYGTINCEPKSLINVLSMDSSAGRCLVLNALPSCAKRSFKKMMFPAKSNNGLAKFRMFFLGTYSDAQVSNNIRQVCLIDPSKSTVAIRWITTQDLFRREVFIISD